MGKTNEIRGYAKTKILTILNRPRPTHDCTGKFCQFCVDQQVNELVRFVMGDDDREIFEDT
jgi:hypothetical protein